MLRHLLVIILVTVIQGDQTLHNRLYQEILTTNPNDNIIYSPFSIQLCLGLAHIGARGATANEISEVIGSTNDRLSHALTDLNKQSVLQVANKAYVKSGYDLSAAYQTSIKDALRSDVESIDFGNKKAAAKTINDWIEHQTNHKIMNVVDPGGLDADTLLLLVNAVYFKALWKNPFIFHSNETFTNYDGVKKKLKFMKQMEVFNLKHSEELSADILKLDYKDTNIAMYIILPDEVTGLANIERNLNKLNFGQMVSEMEEIRITLYMPPFEFDLDLPLNEPLKHMGMKTAFASNADFSGIFKSSQHVSISKVIHKAFIKVDEKGTEAGAVTVMTVSKKSRKKSKQTIMIDRPFMFAIVSEDIETPLFIGAVKHL